MTARRATLAVACIATAMLMLDIAVVNTALAHIADDLHSGLTGLQWIVDAYVLTMASLVVTAGSLADRLGRRRVFQTGLVIFIAASLACGLAQRIAVLDIARAVQGAGAALLFASALSLLAEAFPEPADRGRALAAYGATIGASFAVGPLVGGALTSGLSWRWVFFINVPLGLGAFALAQARVADSRPPAARRLDWLGQVLLAGGLLLAVLGLLRGNELGWGSATIVAELAGAVVLLAAFMVSQGRVRDPLLPLRFFASRQFSAAQASTFAVSASFFAVYLYSTLYLQEVLGLSAISTGLVYLPATLLVFGASAVSAMLLQRVSAGTLVVGGVLLVSAGLALQTIAGATSSWTALVPGLVACGIGSGLFNPAVRAIALSSVSDEDSGVASGVNDAFSQTGIAVGVAAYGAMVPAAAAVGHGGTAAFVDGFHHALFAAAAVALAGALTTAALLSQARPAQRVATEAA